MKSSRYLLLFALLLCSCAAPTEIVRTTTAVTPTLTLTFTPTPTATLTPTPPPPDLPQQGDYLIYTAKKHLMFYDPATNTHIPLLPDWEIEDFSVGGQKRLAFSSFHDGNRDIFLLDYPFTQHPPLNITRGTFIAARPLSWSPDGRYLVYESTRVDGKALMIWDGTTSVPVYQYRVAVRVSAGELAWSPDGRLAFSVFYTSAFPYAGDPVEILLWDGIQTVSLSQNPSGDDRYPAWSADGRLAFLSARGGEYGIFIWDGVSKINGVPDARTFINVAPTWTSWASEPVWTHSGGLAFTVNIFSGRTAQIYAWDGETVTNISQNPDAHNGSQNWRSDGYWAFATFFSRSQVIYVRDQKNQTQLVTEGQYRPAWSPAGRLAFCVPKLLAEGGWDLAIWDGEKVLVIVHGYEIDASWSNGDYVVCSSG